MSERRLAQLGRVLPWGGRGRWFESSISDFVDPDMDAGSSVVVDGGRG